MSPFRPDRRRRGPDPFLGQKMLLLVVGAVLGIAGMATNRAWLVYTAAAVLSIGVLLRFFARPRDSDYAEGGEHDRDTPFDALRHDESPGTDGTPHDDEPHDEPRDR